jgi:hypothetical protein
LADLVRREESLALRLVHALELESKGQHILAREEQLNERVLEHDEDVIRLKLERTELLKTEQDIEARQAELHDQKAQYDSEWSYLKEKEQEHAPDSEEVAHLRLKIAKQQANLQRREAKFKQWNSLTAKEKLESIMKDL